MPRLRLWAPDAEDLRLHLLSPSDRMVALRREDESSLSTREGIPAGALYRLHAEGDEFPDPGSRYQPEGVHGPSQVTDPAAFGWSDPAWRGIPWDGGVIYELHIGTFTPEGTFSAAEGKLSYLKALGIAAVELMPVADFPGRRGWGYDGVAWFAPARCYGSPDELKSFVDAAHRIGLAVLLDVVYNHLGPDGNYIGRLSRSFFNSRHQTPWGAAVNFDGPGSGPVRRRVIDNVLYWIGEFRFDGLRFDATHAIFDESPRHILGAAAAAARSAFPARPLIFIAEDHRNLSRIVEPEARGGWELDGVYSDDFHHSLRRLLAGDHEGYYRPFAGSCGELSEIIERGWRASFPSPANLRSRVFFLQNHDQVGNRAFGERIHHQIDPAAYRAASALLLFCPETPMLFMGQEWAANSPFLYFTDHESKLGRRVTEGRREEFREFSAFSSPRARRSIPDPQDPGAFLKSKLDWSETGREPHACVLRLYQALLKTRLDLLAVAGQGPGAFRVEAPDENSLLVRWHCRDKPSLTAAIRLKGMGKIDLPKGGWKPILSTEEPRFTPDPLAPAVELSGNRPRVDFSRPGALLLRGV